MTPQPSTPPEDDFYGFPWNTIQNPSVVMILLMIIAALGVKCYGACTFYFDKPHTTDTTDTSNTANTTDDLPTEVLP